LGAKVGDAPIASEALERICKLYEVHSISSAKHERGLPLAGWLMASTYVVLPPISLNHSQ
jgi:hypothetical protein